MSRFRHLLTGIVGALALTAASFVPAAAAPSASRDVQGVDSIPAAFKTLTPDWHPATGRIQGEFNPDHGAVAVDYLRRSTVADLSGVATVRQIELVDRDATTRLGASDYSLWVSDDNKAYRELTGWTFDADVVDGRMTHVFSDFQVEARYIKINTRFDDTAFTFVLNMPANDFRIYGDPPSEPDPGAALKVVDSWEVTTPATFPDVENPEEMNARVPGILRAPNGDILLTFNTSTDANPGGEVRLMRSTDDGRTWGPSRVIATASQFPNGSVASSGEWTVLSDGTILLAYGESVNYVRFNNRESRKFVARSTDNGHTWEGTDEPIELPEPFLEPFSGHGSLLETDDGTLLLPIWGARELVDDWETNPLPKTSGVLRSFDGGVTWSDFSVIAFDAHVPPTFPPFGGAPIASGPSEFDIRQMPSGRLVAMIRTNNGVIDPMRFQSLRSYSDDDGATWSTPQPSGYVAPAASLEFAPCTDSLAEGQTKLLLGHRGITTRGKTLIGVSFDEGVTWQDEFALEDPLGREFYGLLGGEPNYLRLDDRHLLVVFQASDADNPNNPPGQVTPPWQIMANVIEDASPEECQAQAAAAQQHREANPTVFVQRADRDEWTWPMAARDATQPSTTTVAALATVQAPALSCRADQPLALRDEAGHILDPTATLAQAGVANGDTVELVNPDPVARPFRIGTAELDVFPGTRHVFNWDDACAYAQLPLDYQARSLGLDVVIPAGQAVSAIELQAKSASTRLTESDYQIWSSPDNVHYVEVSGWSFAERVDDGQAVHRFDDLALTDRYLKVSQRYTNAAYTFILGNPREDITVEYSARACDTTINGSISRPVTIDDNGTTCVDGATITGPVTVKEGASVSIRDSRISGPLTSDGATALTVCDTTISSRFTVTGTTGPVLIGQDDRHDCGPNTINGPLTLHHNTSTIWVSHNQVTGAVTVADNTSDISHHLDANRIAGPLRCTGNTPNIAGGDNQVTGPKTGQCSQL